MEQTFMRVKEILFFLLSPLSRNREYSLAVKNNGESQSRFMFRINEGQVKHSHPSGYCDIVSVPIYMGVEANLQIQPRDIKF